MLHSLKNKFLSKRLCEPHAKRERSLIHRVTNGPCPSSLVSHAEYLLEGLPELWVEDGVDERVDAAVEVAEPRGQVEGDVPGHPTQLKLDAYRVDDVAREEGYPTDEETS